MTGIAAIDESGDTGNNGSRYFVMAALLTSRSRHFLNASKHIINKYGECKYYNSKPSTKIDVLTALSETDAVIVAIIVDKWDHSSNYYGTYKNQLYVKVFEGLLSAIDEVAPCNSINILLDRTSSISNQKMTELSKKLSSVRVIDCKKYDSSSNKCIQLADFTVGAIREYYENRNDEFYKLIENRIHCP